MNSGPGTIHENREGGARITTCPIPGCEKTMNPAALPGHIADHGKGSDDE